MKLRVGKQSFKRYVRFKNKAHIKLKSTPQSWLQVHWEPDQVLEEIFKNGITISDSRVKHLVTELDRRFSQLWHKITHERENNK